MTSAIRLGSRGDSFYEYLLYVSVSHLITRGELTAALRKQFIQTVCVSCVCFILKFGLILNECKDRTEGVYRSEERRVGKDVS